MRHDREYPANQPRPFTEGRRDVYRSGLPLKLLDQEQNQVRSHMAGIMTYLEEHNVFEGTLAEIAEMSGQPRSYKSCALAASILRSCNAIQVSNTGTVFRLDLAFPEEFFSLYEPGDWKVNRHISLSTHRSAYSRTDKDILSIQSGGYNLNFKQIGSGLAGF
jgi:hypothetical protein